MELGEIKKTIEDGISALKTQIDSGLVTKDEQIKALKAEVVELQKSLKSVEENLRSQKVSDAGLGDAVKEEGFSISKVIKAELMRKASDSDYVDNAKAGKEFEMMKTARQYYEKVGLLSDGSNLGYLVPPTYSQEIIDLAIASMPIFGLGITTMNNLTGDLYLPKATGRPSAYYVGEIEQPTKSNSSVGQIKLTPHKIGAHCQISNTLAKNSGGSADAFIKKMLVEAMQLKMHEGAITGTGVDKQVKGLQYYSGINDVTGSSAKRFNTDQLSSMYWKLAEVDELTDLSKLGALMHTIALEGLVKEKVQMFSGQAIGTAMPVSTLAMIMNPTLLEQLVGQKIKTSTQVPKNLTLGASTTCSPVFYGDWSQFILANWQMMEIKVTDILNMPSDLFDLVAFSSFDIGIKKESAFVISKDAETTRSSWTV